MSLDVELSYSLDAEERRKAVGVLREAGLEHAAEWFQANYNPDRDGGVFSANITHNLHQMAEEAGIHRHLWSPEEIGVTHARQLIEPLEKGLALMKSDPPRFEAHNSPNGWGLYEHFVPWIERYLEACKDHPEARVAAHG